MFTTVREVLSVWNFNITGWQVSCHSWMNVGRGRGSHYSWHSRQHELHGSVGSLPSCSSVPLGVTWNCALADAAFTLFDRIQGTLSSVTPNLLLGLQTILPNLCPRASIIFKIMGIKDISFCPSRRHYLSLSRLLAT